MIDFYAKEPHFRDHMEPVFKKITEAGYEAKWVQNDVGSSARYAVVASSGDLERATRDKKMVFFMEHGAGQSYNVRHTSYAGGPNRQNVCMFLSPGPHVTAQNLKFYPQTPYAAVGVPKLDKWHREMSPEPPDPKSCPTVVFSFHWDCHVCPETRSGFEHFKESILEINKMRLENGDGEAVNGEFNLVGHAHPRIRKIVRAFCVEHGIPFLDNFEDVLDQADVYVCDNSSTIFEFASIGKPVVLLNPPMYRKSITHGLRFWEYADIGPNAKDTKSLLAAIRECIHETREDRIERKYRINEIYYPCDGQASERAANAILDFIEEMDRVEAEGNMILCKRPSLGIFGLLDPGQTVLVFPGHAIVNDTMGCFRRRLIFTEAEPPDRRIRRVLKSAPRNYELVGPTIDLDVRDEESEGFRSKPKGFTPVDRGFDDEELFIMRKIKDGLGKTAICYRSTEYKREDLLSAWAKLESSEIIIPGNGQFLWEVNLSGSNSR